MCTRVALHPLVGWKLSQGCPETVVLSPQGGTSHNIERNPQVAITMVTHLQGGNNPITGTSPLPPLSHVTQWDMANFHHITPTMEKATMSQRLSPSPLHQAPGSYHGSQSCPSSGYPALSETHYHPSQVPSSAQRSVTEHTHSGGRNTGLYNPPGQASTHNPVCPPGYVYVHRV